ncbi:MAG: HAD family phosphatase [Eubacterium sp.]|nr:HAD family phosphatase [Eubacterium sp.]
MNRPEKKKDPRTIQTVVFDVGDVLINFRYRDHMKDLGFSPEAVDFLSENMVLTEYWHEMDMGIRMEKDAVEHFTQLFPQYDREIRTFWAHTEGLVEEYPYSAPMIRRLRELGYGVYLLSNYPTETAARHWPTFTFLPETDGYIISGPEKMTKPDPRIYRLLESRFGVNLSSCLFIDDRTVNLDGAAAVGMHPLLFTGYPELVQELKEWGIDLE